MTISLPGLGYPETGRATNKSVTKIVEHRRRRIWELKGGWHCSIIGTCLTIADLRSLARKLRLKIRPESPVDYQYHGYFAQNSGEAGRTAKLLNKSLDKRHAPDIRTLRGVKTESELESYWVNALDVGNIPGPYWAILSHPASTPELCNRMFADVHMLSHLVGASNRADIRRLYAMEEDIAQLTGQLSHQMTRQRDRLLEKEERIEKLQGKLRHLQTTSHSVQTKLFQPKLASDEKGLARLQKKISRLEANAAQSEALIHDQRDRIGELTQLSEHLSAENRDLEHAFFDDRQIGEGACPVDLGGRCLLYVGGRQNTVHRLRSLVEDWNGEFLHHDGGLEKSLGELAGAVVRADVVVFPTDCVSHEAALTVKRLCQRSMKLFVPLRGSGVASFISGLRTGLDGILPKPETN